MDIEKIEQPQAVHQNVSSPGSKVMLEKSIEIGCTTAKEEQFGVRISMNIVRKPLPMLNCQTRRGHGAHERLKKAVMGLVAVCAGGCLKLAQIPDEFRKGNGRRAAVITCATSEA